MICTWYLAKITTRDISKLSQIMHNNFEISLVVFMPNITTNHAITYTNPQYIVSNLYLPRVSPGGAFICVPSWVLLIEGRSYHGSSISGWQQNQWWRQRQGEQQKNKMFIMTTTTLHVNHAILYSSLPSLHHCNMKLPNFTSPLYGVGEHNTKIVAFFF